MKHYDSIKSSVNQGMIDDAAQTLGEDKGKVCSAVKAALPAFLAKLLNKSETSKLEEIVKDAGKHDTYSNREDLFKGHGITNGMNLGERFENELIGSNNTDFPAAVAAESGISSDSADRLGNWICGLIAGYMGNQVSKSKKSFSSLISELRQEKNGIHNDVPSRLAKALGITLAVPAATHANTNTHVKTNTNVHATAGTSANNVRRTQTTTTTTSTNNQNKKKNNYSWIWWLLVALVVLILIIVLSRSCNRNTTADSVARTENVNRNNRNTNTNARTTTVSNTNTSGTAATTATTTTTTNASSSSNASSNASMGVNNRTAQVENADNNMRRITLPNGKTITVARGGCEDQMIQYLNSGNYNNASQNDLQANWLHFDNLDFVHNSATQLTEGSMKQLDNIAEILSSYPNMKIKLGGFADATGTQAVNMDISEQRADYVKSVFTSHGVAANRISTEGFGKEFATVPADATDAQRAIDRSIAMRFDR